MAKTGRPRIQIDKNQFEKLCGLQCTEVEIAAFFNCSIDAIQDFCKREYGTTFADTLNKYGSVGKISLRRSQFKLAERSATMAIFLGKQYLDQKDITYTSDIDENVINEVEEMVFNVDEKPSSELPTD